MITTKDPTPIWLDCDTGHDDAFAILLAARHPDVKLLGISTVYGNAPLTKTTYNTRAILKAIGREDVPVYAGAAKPFCRQAAHSPEIHGESGLDGTTCLPIPEVDVKADKTAVNAMYEALISAPKGSAWLVPTGAFTNAALLFATHPDLIEHIGGVSFMGGAIGAGFTSAPMGTVSHESEGKERFGNITPYAEFNIYIDPESAKSILSHPVLASKTTLITLDLTHLFLATEEVQHEMLYGNASSKDSRESSPVRKLFVEILTFFAKTYADVFNIIAGPPVHDPLAVAAAFAPHLFKTTSDSGTEEKFEVDVITDGAHRASSAALVQDSQCGRTVARPVPAGANARGVTIPRGLDAQSVWRMLNECLERSETQHQ